MDYFADSFFFWISFVYLATWLAVMIAWARTMQHALELVNPQFRAQSPGSAWLTLIPFLGFVWQFFISVAVADGLKTEFSKRAVITRDPRPGFSLGLSANILFCCLLIPQMGLIVALFGNITRLMHLLRVRHYTKQLLQVINAPYVDQQNFFTEYVDPFAQAEKEIEQNNPSRFKPPFPENDEERWQPK